ncbi:hypothetical protein C8Q77DRAFT_813452 [Trametes polyzona]|nr:hypothetical protein C8Q77DRAFT_813452 [Trametes polyzona]
MRRRGRSPPRWHPSSVHNGCPRLRPASSARQLQAAGVAGDINARWRSTSLCSASQRRPHTTHTKSVQSCFAQLPQALPPTSSRVLCPVPTALSVDDSSPWRRTFSQVALKCTPSPARRRRSRTSSLPSPSRRQTAPISSLRRPLPVSLQRSSFRSRSRHSTLARCGASSPRARSTRCRHPFHTRPGPTSKSPPRSLSMVWIRQIAVAHVTHLPATLVCGARPQPGAAQRAARSEHITHADP